MNSCYKKVFPLCIVLVLLISLVCPSCQLDSVSEIPDNFLSCKNILYLERFCSVNELGLSGEGVSRHILQSLRRQTPKVIPFGIQSVLEDKVQAVKIANCNTVEVIFLAVFMTIIIYIFRTDGKKRVFVNN